MHYTNKYNLPPELCESVAYNDYTKGGADYSATELIGPPQIRQLKLRHADEMVEDYSDGIFRLFGQLGHKLLERSSDYEAFHEERLSVEINGCTISGSVDACRRYSDNKMLISDYKFTSKYASQDAKSDWIAQLNIYDYLWHENGFDIDKLQIVAIHRDWSAREHLRGSDYQPVKILSIPKWGHEKTLKYIEERLLIHELAGNMPDEELPPCSPDERWAKPDVWAVMKSEKHKRATKLYDNEEEAQEHADKIGGVVVFRKGESVRCEDYCPVKQFCHQYKAMQNET